MSAHQDPDSFQSVFIGSAANNAGNKDKIHKEENIMKKSLAMIRNFLANEDGATAVEYGLMVALIAAVVIVGAGLLGTNTEAVFEAVADAIVVATP
jgi:pilus assembly protein Flp/PilA